MRRGAKPTKPQVEATPPVARTSLTDEGSRVRELEKRLTEALERQTAAAEVLQTRNRELSEAQEQQTATSEILRVISSSPTDVQPTFDVIAANATRLCDAVNGLVIRFDGHLMHLAAHHNISPERLRALEQIYPMAPNRGSGSRRALVMRACAQLGWVYVSMEYTTSIALTVHTC